ncbi:MAG: hypothetical protein PUA51_05710 [Oscillospiraceae bacterium]|nr:hypothetical protein [Oscillospiraceae bacterium]
MVIDENFVQKLGEDFLWNIVYDYVCKDLEKIKDTLIKNVGYVEIEDIKMLTSAEIQESDEFIINEYAYDSGTLTAKFEMPAIIIAESDNEEVCLRITTSCEGAIEIPDVDTYDWDSLNFADMMLPQILEYRYMVKVISISYEYIEADDLNA